MAAQRQTLRCDGHDLSVANLDKVLYPAVGFTKAEVLDYYLRIAPVMLTHLHDRGVTLRRFPDGVDGPGFFEKRCPGHRPDWIGTCLGPGDHGGPIGYCRLDSTAALVWAANMAAIELHAPMARGADIEAPEAVVFDLDPGAPAAIAECAEVALWVRDVLAGIDLASFAKTSGSKGMQVYVPLNAGAEHTHEHASSFALAVGQVIERAHPSLVVTNMAKAVRTGKIFVDWSQNSRHKTTICAYSLRARPEPTASTPVAWHEVEEAADGAPLAFLADEVLERVEEHGDLFAEVTTMVQHLPAART